MRQARSIAVGVAHTKSRVQNAAAAATATDFFTIESVFLRTIHGRRVSALANVHRSGCALTQWVILQRG